MGHRVSDIIETVIKLGKPLAHDPIGNTEHPTHGSRDSWQIKSAVHGYSDPYECTWNPVTEWALQPEQDVVVKYFEPNNRDRVINVNESGTGHRVWVVPVQ